MKVVWIGFAGTETDEIAQGLFEICQDPLFIITGTGSVVGMESYHLPKHRRKIPSSIDEVYLLLKEEKPDLIFYQDYSYDILAGRKTEETFVGSSKITEDDRWKYTGAIKILHDAESFQPRVRTYYKSIAGRFDCVYTYNKYLLEDPIHKNTFFGLPAVSSAFLTDRPIGARGITVSMTGSSLDKDYRRNLASYVDSWGNETSSKTLVSNGSHGGAPFHTYLGILWSSIVHVCSFSSPFGSLQPIHPKKKHLEAILCGAMPLIENEGIQFMHKDIPHLSFDGTREGFYSAMSIAEKASSTAKWCMEIKKARKTVAENHLHKHNFIRLMDQLKERFGIA